MQVAQDDLDAALTSNRAQTEALTNENQQLRRDLLRLREQYHSKCEELRRREEVSLSFQASDTGGPECLAGVMELKYQEEIAVLQGVRSTASSQSFGSKFQEIFGLFFLQEVSDLKEKLDDVNSAMQVTAASLLKY